MPHSDKDSLLVSLGRKIRILREGAHMTHAELARKLRVRKEVVIKIEKGEYNILLGTLLKILRIFDGRLKLRFITIKGGV